MPDYTYYLENKSSLSDAYGVRLIYRINSDTGSVQIKMRDGSWSSSLFDSSEQFLQAENVDGGAFVSPLAWEIGYN